ncbi:MAG: bifunctional adenosylcobinamide kinase/adenosylcobinamide-phosphate guanylyltransferase [Candidatus Sedimenticola sp. (ex Thyasira tokunagai)]
MKQLILGGARSGKSTLAESLAEGTGLPVLYVATATAEDKAMAERIAFHQSRRSHEWDLVEEPLDLARVLKEHARSGRCILVDCLTLWLTNILLREEGVHLKQEMDALVELLPQLPGEIIFVSNEVGMGVVPMGEQTRRFVDESGWMHQRIAALCDRVILTVAGLPQVLKGDSSGL